jgi:phage-related protein
MSIIQKGLNPFEGWLDNKGSQGGLGIFTQLEKVFQRNLPSAIQAGTQAFELFAKTVDYVATNFGGKLIPYLAKFFTHINNSKSAMNSWHRIIRELVNDFFDVWDVVKNLIKVLASLFSVFQGAGATVLQILAQILASIAKWFRTSGKGAATAMFGAHESQLLQIKKIIADLMPILEAAANGFMVLEATVSAAITPILRIVAAIVGFISHLVQSHGPMGRIARDFLGFVTGAVVATLAIRRFVSYFDLVKRVGNVIKGASDVIKGVGGVIKGVGDYITYARVLASEFADKFKAVFSNVVGYAKSFASGVGNAFSSVRSFLGNFMSTIGNVAKSVWSFVSSAISNVINLAKTWVSNIVEMVTSSEMFGPMMFGILAIVVVVVILIITHWKTVKRWAIEIWHFIARFIEQIWHKIYATISNFLHIIASIWSTEWQIVVDIFTGKFSQIPRLAKKLLHDFIALVEAVIHDLAGNVSEMFTIGERIVEGLVHGLMSGIGWIGKAVSSIGKTILGGVKKIFGIFSPSREMATLGNYLMLGLAQGITDGTTHALSAMTGASNQLLSRSHAAFNIAGTGAGATRTGLGGGMTMNVEAHFTINAQGGDAGAIRKAIGDAATEFSHQVLVSMRAGAGRLY